ncbi:hypothetical protein HK100_012560 [Physocladia obscura]|uniref:Pyridoxamine 5'-phosphate oxidase Alr4036 family FMN-binding domain-containing protein n=1 Tax=Physocladia obscura TaxID=109957 RepID=A0AAD5T1B7_9FUNG|nr:hypothetical protein HK100_012560 [Physocladia obscura]
MSDTVLQQQAQQAPAVKIFQEDVTITAGSAWPSWIPTINTNSIEISPNTDDDATNALNNISLTSTEAHFPPWRAALETALKENERDDAAHLYASLATIKSFGRPSNHCVFFRGFLSDGIESQTIACTKDDTSNNHHNHHHHHHRHQHEAGPLSVEAVERLANVLVFAVDVRSGSVDDLVHGSKFGEICWIFPETRQQIRVSGTIQLITSPNHILAKTHQISSAPSFASLQNFPALDWESLRREMWRKVSAVRRASYTWPTTRHDVTRSGSSGYHQIPPVYPNIVDAAAKNSVVEGGVATTIAVDGQSGREAAVGLLGLPMVTSLDASSDNEFARQESLETVIGQALEDPHQQHRQVQKNSIKKTKTHHHHDSKQQHEHRTIAFNNFCLLLLDVDGVDNVEMSKAPHAHTKYRRTTESVSGISGTESVSGFVRNTGNAEVVRVSVADRIFSIDDLAGGEGGCSTIDGLVKRLDKWTVKDVLG